MTAFTYTPWNTYEIEKRPEPMTMEERHEAFSKFAEAVANSLSPWLYPLLEAANAAIYTQPNMFVFRLPNDTENHWREIPELSKMLAMVPWTESDEA